MAPELGTVSETVASDPRDDGQVLRSRRANLKRLLSPRHIAFVGGRDTVGAIDACRNAGFQGPMWAVNPGRDELGGLACYPDIASLPEAPDATFIGVPATTTVEVVAALAERGAGGCVCYAAGFAEIGGHGRELQRRLVATAGDLALIGPNCYGLLNYLDGCALWPDQHGGARLEHGIALITQSGNIGLNLTMHQRSLPLAYMISAGNQAVLDIGDYVAALADDPRVDAIGIHIEGLGDVVDFTDAALHALERGVPIVALKSGNSAIGAQLTLSHTSSLAGPERLHDALFERTGVIRVHSLTALLETVKLLGLTGPMPGRRLRSLSCSGGEASLVADLGEKLGFEFPPHAQIQAAALRSALPDFVTISNPFDYNTSIWGNRALAEEVFTHALTGDFDAGLLVLDFPRPTQPGFEAWEVMLDSWIAARQRTGCRAVVASSLPELFPEAFRRRAIEGGVTPILGLEEALTALRAAAWYGETRERLLAPGDLGRLRVRAIPTPEGDSVSLDEWSAKQRLAATGLLIPAGRAVTPDEAGDAADALGYPVAVKVIDAGLAHKSELGAVVLGLGDRATVLEAVSGLQRIMRDAGRPLQRLLVERMIDDGVAELIIGVSRDPMFGLTLLIGSGGVLVELLRDSRSLLLPTDRDTVAAAIAGLRSYALLTGFRGRPAGDVEAVIEATLRIAAFAMENEDSLMELDVNPLIVRPQGSGAVVADALLRMRTDSVTVETDAG